MGAQVSVPEGVHVVVVGGGFGGIAAAQQLKSRGIKFTLVDLQDAFHHNVAALRAAVQDGSHVAKTFIPYAETFGGSFVQGRVVSVDPERQRVVLEDGQDFQYSHLILCTGTDGPFPGKYTAVSSYQTAIQEYQDLLHEIQASGSVLVVGGGATGLEMAAEVKTEFPDKRVVLVHSRIPLTDPQLLSSVRQQAKDVLLEKGVELVLGQRLCDLSSVEMNVCRRNRVLTTDRGTEIQADLVLCCTGLKINSAAYASSLPDCVAEGGGLRVNAHLQVASYPNVYAVGDCADTQEPKLAYHASLHAAVAVTNIGNSLAGKELCSYSPASGNVTMLLAMGCDDGVGQFKGFHLPRCAVVLAKSKNLMLWKSWREMDQSSP
ncbi:hypothetical protein NHX12_022923 [Muraenolepis orangiensis]|uniref:Ferroptosis suppressor protein 1 n=1 Tax=Muraenolepis orangiensis TaxID=630683 RepID=A0A9Q0ESF9_9TELE|nr:hypothetical protein NHX12_022923 [Muraenolepis orangiensis]